MSGRNAVQLPPEKEKVDIRLALLIYELTDQMKKAMTGMLERSSRSFQRRVSVRKFQDYQSRKVAELYVHEGSVGPNNIVGIRDNV